MRSLPIYGVLQCLLMRLVRSQLCSWVEPVTKWTNGQRDLLKLNIDEYSTYWNVTFKFDQDIIFEVTANLTITSYILLMSYPGMEGRYHRAVPHNLLHDQQMLQWNHLPLPVPRAGVPHQVPGRRGSSSKLFLERGVSSNLFRRTSLYRSHHH